jgi:predicted hydrocarbon binding protein
MSDTTVSKEKFAEHILPDNYVQFSPLIPEITVNRQTKAMAIDQSFLEGCLNFVNARFPDKTKEVLYDIGYAWGEELYSKVERFALSLFPETRSIKDLSMNQFHQIFTNHLAALGWGNFELKRRDDFLFVDLYNSIFADGIRRGRNENEVETGCDLYAGFFAGIFSRISNMKLACVELTCRLDGYEWCSFLLDNEDTIGAVNAYIRQKFSPLEAFQKVKTEIEEN